MANLRLIHLLVAVVDFHAVEEPTERLLAAADAVAGVVVDVDRRLAALAQEIAREHRAETLRLLSGEAEAIAFLVG